MAESIHVVDMVDTIHNTLKRKKKTNEEIMAGMASK